MRFISIALLAAAAAAPAAAQDDPARRAEALDRALGPNAELPKPEFGPLPPLNATLPWLSGQPYRQQPLLTGVPPGGTTRGRTRGGGG